MSEDVSVVERHALSGYFDAHLDMMAEGADMLDVIDTIDLSREIEGEAFYDRLDAILESGADLFA